MSLPNYPGNFRKPERVGGTTNVGLRRTTVPVALANQVKDFNAPRVEMMYSFSMTNNEAAVWLDWVFNSIKWSWFRMDIVSPYTPFEIYSNHIVRIMGPINYQKRGDDWCTITTPIEVLQNDAQDIRIPAVEYDWIIAGGPGSAVTDWIIAGTPSSPSAGGIILSHLYYRKE